jgi:hypothetical protein
MVIRPTVDAEEAISAHPQYRHARKRNDEHRGNYRSENDLEVEQKRRSGRQS